MGQEEGGAGSKEVRAYGATPRFDHARDFLGIYISTSGLHEERIVVRLDELLVSFIHFQPRTVSEQYLGRPPDQFEIC
jgi:hypothetical protein